jgi:hypothetical protein
VGACWPLQLLLLLLLTTTVMLTVVMFTAAAGSLYSIFIVMLTNLPS